MRSWQLISLKRWLTSKQNWKQFVRSLAAPACHHHWCSHAWAWSNLKKPGAPPMWVLVLHALNNFVPSPWVIMMIARRDPAIMGWPSTIFQSYVQVGFLRISPYMFWIACKCFETVLEFLRLWLANRSPHSPANRRLVSKECQTHCTLLKYEINLLERKPKTLRIERLRQLDRAAVKLSCNKLCQSVVNCVKTFYLDIYSIDRCWL